MAIRFQCDCGVQLKAEDRLGGKTISCPTCGERTRVPRVGEDPDSYSISGTSDGDEGWAVSQEELESVKPNWKAESTFRPAVAKESPTLPVNVRARPKSKKTQRAINPWLGSFLFPIQGGNAFTLLGWSLGFMFVSLMMSIPAFGIRATIYRLLLLLFVASYFFHFLSEIVRSAAGGDDRLPETDSGLEVIMDAARWWGCVLFGMGPWWGLNLFYLVDSSFKHGAPPAISGCLLILGILYTPMGLLATSMFNTVLAANPVYVLGAIFRIPLQYFFMCFLMVFVFFMYVIMNLFLPNIIIVTNLLFSVLFLYTSIVIMHMLGTVFHRNAERIGWFRT